MATTTDDRPAAFDPAAPDGSGTSLETPGWDLATERRIDDGETLARLLGWFSIGLGALQVSAPGRVCAYLGFQECTTLVRLFGIREIAKGAGLLSQERPRGWVWARLAGDFLDISVLVGGLARSNPKRDRVVAALAAVAGVTVLDAICYQQLGASRAAAESRR